MEQMTPPIVPEEPPAILRDNGLKAILNACAGTDFDARRDTAIIRLLLDTGMRRAELAGLKLDDIDLDQQVAIVPRAVDRGPVRSATRPPRRSITTRGFAWLTLTRNGRSSGSPPGASSPTAACCRCFGAAAPQPDCRSSTRTSSATPTPTSGSPTAATKATSCASPAGRAARCSAATAPRRPTNGREMRIAGAAPATASEDAANGGCVPTMLQTPSFPVEFAVDDRSQ